MCLHATLAESFPATTVKQTKVACIWLICFPSLEKKKRLVVKVQLSIPIDELSTLHPNCRSLRQVRCLTSITSVNSRNSSHIFDKAKFFVSHKVEARNNHQTRTAKLPEPKDLVGWTAGHSRTCVTSDKSANPFCRTLYWFYLAELTALALVAPSLPPRASGRRLLQS